MLAVLQSENFTTKIACNVTLKNGVTPRKIWNYIQMIGTERNSCPELFCKKSVLRNFAKFTGRHL